MKKHPLMKVLALATLSLSVAVGSSFAQDKIGGPVARKLQSLQNDEVGVPVKRPEIQLPPENLPDLPVPTVPEQKQTTDTVEQIKRAATPSACLAKLQQLAEARRAATPSSNDKQCAINDPVELVSTKGRFPVAFANGLILDCKFALALANFTADTLQPLARHHLEAAVIRLGSGQGFVCRRRNNAKTGKLSEHAFGNAFDLTTYVLEGKPTINVRSEQLMKPEEAAFQNAVRKAACGTFTTVLGPGSNPAHATHLHFDLGRSDKKNPYRICE